MYFEIILQLILYINDNIINKRIKLHFIFKSLFSIKVKT